MYFYFLGVPEHVVSAFLTVENSEGTYTLTVFGFKSPQQAAPDFMCVLRNEGPPTSGPTNTVDLNPAHGGGCAFFSLGGGTGEATVTCAVVNATGPDYIRSLLAGQLSASPLASEHVLVPLQHQPDRDGDRAPELIMA